METKNHVNYENPYHYSFSLCAENKVNGSNESFEENFKHKRGQKVQDSIYSKYLGEVSEFKFYCDRCDRSFSNDEQLKKHIEEHITCGKNGCQFTAHPKIIATHIKMQHKTGLFQKIKKLDNPEEVKKWIEERKRKYPTARNIELKVKLEEAKVKRGEIIKTDTSRFNKDFSNLARRNKRGVEKNSRKPKNIRDIQTKFKRKVVSNLREREVNPSNQNGLIPSFKGLGEPKPAMEADIAINPDDALVSDEDEPVHVECDKPILNKSLALLMSYNTDVSDEEDEIQSSVSKPDDDAPEEVKTVKTTEIFEKENITEESIPPIRKRKINKLPNNTKRIKSKWNPELSKTPRERKPTLLQKLLHDDIVHEKKVILECIQFIVQNNFFKSQENNKMQKREEKPRLLKKLLKDEITRERNIIFQCIKYIVDANFFQ